MHSVYIHAGTNPFDTITQAVKYVVFYVARLDSSKFQVPTTAAITRSSFMSEMQGRREAHADVPPQGQEKCLYNFDLLLI
jgi:hypothetical protein